MTTDIVLEDREVRIEGDDPEPILAVRQGEGHTVITAGSIRLAGQGIARLHVSDDRGEVSMSSGNVRAANVRVTDALAATTSTTDTLEAGTITVGFGPTGEGASGAPGRLEVQNAEGRTVVTIDGESGDVEIAGFGKVTEVVARLQARLEALQARVR